MAMTEFKKNGKGLISSLRKGDVEYPLYASGPWSMDVRTEMLQGSLNVSYAVKELGDAIEIGVEAHNASSEPCFCGRLRFLTGLDMHMVDYP